jgi:hypothetical protein
MHVRFYWDQGGVKSLEALMVPLFGLSGVTRRAWEKVHASRSASMDHGISDDLSFY